jgi:hypothetical protein
MAEEFDPAAMIERFRARARAVRERGIPPLEGPERKRFVDQARIDYQDYAMIGDAEATLEAGILTLRIDLRPQGERASGQGSQEEQASAQPLPGAAPSEAPAGRGGPAEGPRSQGGDRSGKGQL